MGITLVSGLFREIGIYWEHPFGSVTLEPTSVDIFITWNFNQEHSDNISGPITSTPTFLMKMDRFRENSP